jgi:hypothetical protein
MNADFLDAHYRHWQDAELLFGRGRLANADHLYGLAAECGLTHGAGVRSCLLPLAWEKDNT